MAKRKVFKFEVRLQTISIELELLLALYGMLKVFEALTHSFNMHLCHEKKKNTIIAVVVIACYLLQLACQ